MFKTTFSKKLKEQKGFTLIELLIVIAIIAIIAAVVFVALDPLTRFQDSRDSSRWSDVSNLLGAVKLDQVDNGGAYLTAILADDITRMIGDGTTGCNTGCTDLVGASTTACVSLGDLVTQGYLGSVPVSPDGESTWSADTTGYALTADATGIITIEACDAENSASDIKISR